LEAAPEVEEAEAVGSLLELLDTGLPKTLALAATRPLLQFVSQLLSDKEVLDAVSQETVIFFCELAATRLPVVVQQMTEPSFDTEFGNDMHGLALEIFSQCTQKGLSIATSPLKDLKRVIDSQLRLRPARPPVWKDFDQLDWTLENSSFKKLNDDVRLLLLVNLKKEIAILKQLSRKDAEDFYTSTVKKTLLCSWQMMVPWISVNIFSGNLRGSTCPAMDLLQNWIPVFDAVLVITEPEDLLCMIHEALFLISYINKISAKNLVDPEFSRFFGTDSSFQQLSTFVNLGNCLLCPEKKLRKKICGMAVNLFCLEISETVVLQNLPIWKNTMNTLQEARKVWKFDPKTKFDIFSAQNDFSSQSLDLLKFCLGEAVKFAGIPKPGNFVALMAIGSTSRGDRFPFSDVEFFVMYKTNPGEKQSFHSYLFFLFSIFEFFLVRLGESEFGFRIDPSEHILTSPQKLIGTVSEIFKTHVQKIWFQSPGLIACSEEPDLGEEGRSEIFTSLLNPCLVNLEFGGIEIFSEYSDLMREFLETQVDPWTLKATKLSLESGKILTDPHHMLENSENSEKSEKSEKSGNSWRGQFGNILTPTSQVQGPATFQYFPGTLSPPKTRHLAALMIWMDILAKIEFLEFPLAPEREVDVKLICHKPLVILAQALKIFGNIGFGNWDSINSAEPNNFGKKLEHIEHPSQIFKSAHIKGLISYLALQLLLEMLEASSKLRSKLHASGIYSELGEKRKFSEFSESQQSFIEFCQTIFSRMKKSLDGMIFHKGFEKFGTWNSVMVSLSMDLVLHATGVREYFSKFQKQWITCLSQLPLVDGTRESTKIWKLQKEKVLYSLLQPLSAKVFQQPKSGPKIVIDRVKGSFLVRKNLCYPSSSFRFIFSFVSLSKPYVSFPNFIFLI
jgi:hypothetical protein